MALAETIVEEIPFKAETRTSGARTADGTTVPEGRRRRHRPRPSAACPQELIDGGATGSATPGATPLGGQRRRPRRSA